MILPCSGLYRSSISQSNYNFSSEIKSYKTLAYLSADQTQKKILKILITLILSIVCCDVSYTIHHTFVYVETLNNAIIHHKPFFCLSNTFDLYIISYPQKVSIQGIWEK